MHRPVTVNQGNFLYFFPKNLFRVCLKKPITHPTQNFLKLTKKPISYNYHKKKFLVLLRKC